MISKLILISAIGMSGYMAYPYMTQAPQYHESFSEAATEALESPRNVKVIVLAAATSSKDLQAYMFNSRVVREYSAPPGFTENFEIPLREVTNRFEGEQALITKPKPEYVVRFEGARTTIDIIICSRSNALWFAERGHLKPFYTRASAVVKKQMEPLVRKAIPQTVATTH